MIGSLTVNQKGGASYAANNIQVVRAGWGEDYERSVLVFECSGVLKTIPVEEVLSINVNVQAPLPAGPV